MWVEVGFLSSIVKPKTSAHVMHELPSIAPSLGNFLRNLSDDKGLSDARIVCLQDHKNCLIPSSSLFSFLAITDAEPEPAPPVRNVGRRKSVFAEAYDPEEDKDEQPAVRKKLLQRTKAVKTANFLMGFVPSLHLTGGSSKDRRATCFLSRSGETYLTFPVS